VVAEKFLNVVVDVLVRVVGCFIGRPEHILSMT